MLLPLSGVDRDNLVAQARFLEEKRNFGRIWRRMIVEADHSGFLLSIPEDWPAPAAGIEAAAP